MAEPLTISFQADTSKASSAMASLAASIVGNMTSIGVAMSGGAANTNNFGATLQGLASNASRAAQAVSADVQKIASSTVSAASREGATLEGVVKSFTAAAATSNTAQAAVKSGISGTATAIGTLAAQIPSLGTLLGAFLAFEAAKLVFASVSASIDEAREHVEEFTRIAKDAANAGLGTSVFQRLTLDAKELGLTTQQVVAALNTARAASTTRQGEGEHGRNTSAMSDRLQQNVLAGSLTAGDKAAFDNAATLEAKYRVVLDLIDKLRNDGREVAGLDLAGKFFGADFQRQLENGVEGTRRLRAALDDTATTAGGKRIVDPEEIARAAELERKLNDINTIFASALAPIAKDFSNSAMEIYSHFLDWETSLARSVKIAGDLYGKLALLPSIKIPSIGELATMLGAPALGDKLGLPQLIGRNNPGETNAQAADRRSMDDAKDLLRERMSAGGVAKAIEDSKKLDFRTPAVVRDRSPVLPSLTTKAPSGRSGGSATESLDGVEQLINTLEKARDTAKAEFENVGKTNVEREKAVAIAKAEAAAREDVQKGKRTDPNLDADERARVLAAAGAWQTYKDQVMDAQQALRQTAEQARYFGQMAADGISDAILEAKSFGDVLQSLEKQLAKAALQGIFTGQGPLAGLLGMAPAASSGSNTVGGLAGLFTGSGGLGSLFRANGGPVSAGQAYTVGEAGREMFIPGQDGRIVPIGAGGMGGAPGPVNVYNYAGGDTQATATRRSDGGVDVMVDRLDAALAKRVGAGRGSLATVAGGSRRLRG